MPEKNWHEEIDGQSKSVFSLHDLRTAKNYSRRDIAKALGVSQCYYCKVENGTKKPNIDVLFGLASLYSTSCEFIYHAYYRQSYVWHFPDDDLRSALYSAVKKDAKYLRQNAPLGQQRPHKTVTTKTTTRFN